MYVYTYLYIFMHEKFFTEFYLINLLTKRTSSNGIFMRFLQAVFERKKICPAVSHSFQEIDYVYNNRIIVII